MKDPEELKDLLIPILIADGIITDPPTDKEKSIFDGAFPIIRERLKLLNDVSPMLKFLFVDPGTGELEDAVPKKSTASQAAEALRAGLELLRNAPDVPDVHDEAACAAWDEERDGEFRARAEAQEWKIGAMLQPLRLAVTASKVSPPLFPAIRLLGISESLKRIERLIDALENQG
jgi:glutamyl-tRNA synthetase